MNRSWWCSSPLSWDGSCGIHVQTPSTLEWWMTSLNAQSSWVHLGHCPRAKPQRRRDILHQTEPGQISRTVQHYVHSHHHWSASPPKSSQSVWESESLHAPDAEEELLNRCAFAMKGKTLLKFYQRSYLERITWNCSKEWGELFPITQAGTGGKVTHLVKQAENSK